MTNTEKWELDALRYAQLEELPEELDENTPVWIYGIAEILNYRMEHSYAIVRNSYGEQPNVIRLFGEGGLAQILKVHPYKFLDTRYVPKFSSDSEMKDFLAKAYGVDKTEFAKIKKDTVARLMFNYCIKRQLSDEQEKRKIRAERDIADAMRNRSEKENEELKDE